MPNDEISRRTVIGAAAIASATMLSGAARAAAAKSRKPNILFIMADDLGAFDLSCYGRPDYKTPHIDSLAEHGMKFDLGYANSSTCGPTRTALISGRYQNRLPIGTGWGGGYASDKIGYPANLPSLPGTMRKAGYRTALIGKWGLGPLPNFSPIKSGYDEFFGLIESAFDYWTHDAQDLAGSSERTPALFENEKPVKVEGYATDLFTDRACNFIERNARRPFMLSLHYNAPHWPWQTRNDRSKSSQNDLHYDGGSPAIYRDMVLAMDDGVGRVLDTLRKLDLTRDTLVIFTSDNGGERFSKMWPLRGEKGELLEGGVRVPLIACWPGQIPARSTSQQIAMSMDFLPTLATIAGTTTEPGYAPDGIDLTPQLRGAAPVARTVFWKTPGDSLSALSYPWKFLRLGKREHLFNLAEDPTENANYKLREPEIFARLKKEADIWSGQMLENMRGYPPELMRTFKALDPVPRM